MKLLGCSFTSLFAAVAILVSSKPAQSSLLQNLNYRSPSLSHRSLGISIPKVQKRHLDSAASTAPLAHGPRPQHDGYPHAFVAEHLRFIHGVASGDPYHDSVILWTRVTPPSEQDEDETPLNNVHVQGMAQVYSQTMRSWGKVSSSAICLKYKVASDKDFNDVADEGTVETSSDIDFTVKVEAKNLKPFTTYYYYFSICDNPSVRSPAGTTKTLPLPDADLDRPIVASVFSCANYPFGFFNAYGGPLRQKPEPDYVIHLGDYIYEYGNLEYGDGRLYNRVPKPDKQIVTLQDYRTRFNQHRLDEDAKALHIAKPWITTWDDHEFADNIYKDGAADMNNTEDSFEKFGGVSFDTRKANAVRAYYEWMPLRQVDMDEKLRIWRNFSVGNLFDLVMPDTRVYDRSITDLYWNFDYMYKIYNDEHRSIMGERQENWFFKQLSYSQERGAAWRLVGNQVLFSPFNISAKSSHGDTSNPFALDSWAGYRASFNRTIDHLHQHNISNTLILSGDSHSAWAADVPYPYPLFPSPYQPPPNPLPKDYKPYDSVAVEFGGTAITSPSSYGSWEHPKPVHVTRKISDGYLRDNWNMVYAEGYYRGWFDLQISYEKTVARYWGVNEMVKRDPGDRLLATFEVENGKNRIGKRWVGDDKGSGSMRAWKEGE